MSGVFDSIAILRPYKCAQPPNGGLRGWLVVLASFSIYVVSVGFQYATGVFYKAWVHSPEFAAVEPSTLAWANSIEAGCFLCGSLVGGWIISHSSTRSCNALGALCIGVGALVANIFAGSGPLGLLSLYAGFGVLVGSGNSLTCLAAICSVQQYFSSRRGTATGLVVAGSGVGAFVLGPLLETMTNAMGWRSALMVYGFTAAGVCILSSAALVPIILIVPGPQITEAGDIPLSEPSVVLHGGEGSGASTQSEGVANECISPAKASDAGGTRLLPYTCDSEVPERVHAVLPTSASDKADESTPTRNTTMIPNSKSAALAPFERPPTYADLLGSPGLVAFSLCLAAGAVMWFMVPTVSAQLGIQPSAVQCVWRRC